MVDNRPIGIFDSGLGGLTVLTSIKKLLPGEKFVFLADQANVPYGVKTQEQLEMLTDRIVDFLAAQDVKLIVVACNTATVYAIESMRKRVKMPVIGTVPVVKSAAEKSKTKKAAVFSTPATAKSKYLAKLIKKFSNGVEFYTVGGTNLENLVENGDLDNPEIEKAIKNALIPLVDKGVDVVALGCTHYPFLKGKIEKVVGKDVLLLDSGDAIARRTRYILEHEGLLSGVTPLRQGSAGQGDIYYTTGDAGEFKKTAEKLLQKELDDVRHIGI